MGASPCLAWIVALGLPAWSALPAQDTWARVQRDGVLRWGVDWSGGAPFAFLDPRQPDHPVGFEIDLVRALCARLGVRSEPVRADWLALIDELRTGRIDLVLNGLEVTPERARVVDFTQPYFRYEQQWTVRAADRGRFGGIADLRGHRIGVLNGSASLDVLRAAGFEPAQIAQYDDSLAPYTELELGRVDAVLAESIIAAYYAGRNPALANLPQTFAPGVYAGAVRPQEQAWLAALDGALQQLREDGTLGAIYARWGIWDARQRELGIAPPPAGEAEATPAATATASIVPLLLQASLTTLLLTALAMPLALVAGLALALAQACRRAWLRWPARLYVQVVRGTPLLVQIFLIYYSLPRLGIALGLGDLLTWNNVAVGVLCLGANYAAYEAELHRAGIEAVGTRQRDAALALGLLPRTAFLRIVLPQSLRTILPAIVNDLISMLKDSCLVSVIGVPELLGAALAIGKARFEVPELLGSAAVLYLLMSLGADWLGRRLEARLRSEGSPVVALREESH